MLRICTEFVPNPSWGFQRYCHPPENMGHLGGRPHHSSGASTELRILEFYLHTYNVGLDSTVKVLFTIDIHVSGINVGL